jgi:uncharacterized membrane protein YphA (DoxX/SURF4 family)
MMLSIFVFLFYVTRYAIGALLVAAGAAKLTDISGFSETLTGLGIAIPKGIDITRWLAIAVPVSELAVGLGLVIGISPSLFGGMSLVLSASFTGIVAFALRKRLTIMCRCFGALSTSQFSVVGLLRSALITVGSFLILIGALFLPLSTEVNWGATVLLAVGYILFGCVVAQAAATLAYLQERLVP